MRTLKCNHDIKVILGCGSKHVAAYICKYCMKRQSPVENQLGLSLAAFNKAAERTQTLPIETEPEVRGYKLISSMLYHLTNGQELAAPMAAWYIQRQSPLWFSHEVIHVNVQNLSTKTSR